MIKNSQPIEFRRNVPQHIHACVLSHFSHVQLFAILWTVASQAPLSMGFSRQEYWSELPCPPSGGLPNPGIKPISLMSSALAGRFFTTSATWEVHMSTYLAAFLDVHFSSCGNQQTQYRGPFILVFSVWLMLFMTWQETTGGMDDFFPLITSLKFQIIYTALLLFALQAS